MVRGNPAVSGLVAVAPLGQSGPAAAPAGARAPLPLASTAVPIPVFHRRPARPAAASSSPAPGPSALLSLAITKLQPMCPGPQGHLHNGRLAAGRRHPRAAHHQQEPHLNHLLRGGGHLRRDRGHHPADQGALRAGPGRADAAACWRAQGRRGAVGVQLEHGRRAAQGGVQHSIVGAPQLAVVQHPARTAATHRNSMQGTAGVPPLHPHSHAHAPALPGVAQVEAVKPNPDGTYSLAAAAGGYAVLGAGSVTGWANLACG